MAIAVFLGATCQIFDDNGDPLAGGKVYAYERGTSTPKDTYTDETLGTPNANPVILDSSGRAPIFLDGSYKIIVHDSSDVLVDELDPVNYSSAASTSAGTGGNVVSNGSFEDNAAGDNKTPDGWTLTEYTGSTVTLDTVDPDHGAKCVKATSAGNGGCLYETTAYFEVSDTRAINVSFHVKSDAVDVRNLVELQWYTAAQTSLSTTSVWDESAANPAAWTLKTFNVTPPATARYAKLRLYACHPSDGTTGTTRYDNVFVEGGAVTQLWPEVEGFPDLGNGFLAKTTTETYAVRTATAADTSVTVTNGDGVSGNPTFEVPGGFKAVASDEGSPADGETWYNTTTKQYKGYRAAATGVWSNNATVAKAVQSGPAGFGVTNAASAIAGGTSSTATYETTTQEFDDVSWTTGGALNTGRKDLAGCGTLAAGLCFCGDASVLSAVTEEYDGAAWANVNAHSSARHSIGGAGSQIDAISVGGWDGARDAECYEYDGTNWSAGGTYTLAYTFIAAAGALIADTVAFGGTANGLTPQNDCQTYNGSSWSTENDIGTARFSLEGGGTQSDAFLAGGQNSAQYATTEIWDGADWSAGGDLNTARTEHGGTGINSDGMVVSGSKDVGYVTTSESNSNIIAGNVIFTITTES